MSSAKTILKAALLVGTLDMTAALAQYFIKTGRVPFKPVLRFVASGLLGREAFSGGDGMMVVGLLVHYCIATVFTVVFFLTLARLPLAGKQKLLAGIFYGALVWVVMNLLILPVTSAPRLTMNTSEVVISMGILICCIGLPLSFIAGGEQEQKKVIS